MSERRFSGSDRTPCAEQILWSYYNAIVDQQGLDALNAEDINEVEDHFLYELSKRMSLEELSKKFFNAKPEEIKARIIEHAEKAVEVESNNEVY